MKECERTEGCIFFNDKMRDMPATADILKQKFCRNEFASCARYMVLKALGKPGVPDDLFPQQTEKAKNIIRKG